MGTIILLDLNDMVKLLLKMDIGHEAAAETLVDVATGAAAPRAIANALADDETAESLRAGAAAGNNGLALEDGASGHSISHQDIRVMCQSVTAFVGNMTLRFEDMDKKVDKGFKSVSGEMKKIDKKVEKMEKVNKKVEKMEKVNKEEMKDRKKTMECRKKRMADVDAQQGSSSGTVKRKKLSKVEKFNKYDEHHEAAFMDRVKNDMKYGGESAVVPKEIIEVMLQCERIEMDVLDVREAMGQYYRQYKMQNRSLIGYKKNKQCYPGFHLI